MRSLAPENESSWAIVWRCLRDSMFSRFGTIPGLAREGRTDTWRQRIQIYDTPNELDSAWDDQPFERYGWCPPKFKWFT